MKNWYSYRFSIKLFLLESTIIIFSLFPSNKSIKGESQIIFQGVFPLFLLFHSISPPLSIALPLYIFQKIFFFPIIDSYIYIFLFSSLSLFHAIFLSLSFSLSPTLSLSLSLPLILSSPFLSNLRYQQVIYIFQETPYTLYVIPLYSTC